MSPNMQKIAALAALIPLVAGHGYISSPTPRKPGDAYEAACGQQPYYQQTSDINGNVQGILQVVGDDFDASACNLWLCKGFLLADSADSAVQSYSAGETVDFEINIAAPHTGYANVSVVKTSSNSIIGSPLIEFDNYASNSGVAANNTAFSVTIPDDLGSECSTAGDCVLQWFWNAPDIDQTYEGCVDFTVGGSSSGSGSSSETAAASSAVVATSAAAVETSVAATTPVAAVTEPAAVSTTPAANTPSAPSSTPTEAAGDDADEDCDDEGDDDTTDDGSDDTVDDGADDEDCDDEGDDDTTTGDDDTTTHDGDDEDCDDEEETTVQSQAAITQAAVVTTTEAAANTQATTTTTAAQSGSNSSGSSNSGKNNNNGYSNQNSNQNTVSHITSYVTVTAQVQTKYVTVTADAPVCT